MWMLIKEAVAIVAGLALIFYLPIQTRRIIGGWVPANFTGDAADYPAFWAKKAIGFMCLAIGIGVVFLALIPAADGARESIADLAIAAIWLVIAGVTYWCRRQITGPLA